MCFWAIVTLLLSLQAATMFDLFERPFELAHITIAIVGSIWAILAMADAHRAFVKAQQVEEAVGSFRMSFSEIMEEMVRIIRSASKTVRLLLPTPAYGFLFKEQNRSYELVSALEAFLSAPNTKLELVFILGSLEPAEKNIAQAYLRIAQSMSRDIFADYRKLVRRVFDLIKTHRSKTSLVCLKEDPNVRILVADANYDSCISLTAFKADEEPATFDSKGFCSRRRPMVEAMNGLIELYIKERGNPIEPDDLRPQYDTLLQFVRP